MKISVRSWCAGALLCALSAVASAQTYCQGTVQSVLVDTLGNVDVLSSFRNDWIQICNTLTAWNSIDPTVCKQWLGFVTTLRVTQDRVVVYYSTSGLNCATLPTYSNAPVPGYVGYDSP